MQKNRNFRSYFIGSVASDLGTWLQNTAQVLLAFQLSHSVLMVGLVTCAQFSSPLLLGPWAGLMTHRFGGRRTLLITQVAGGACAGLMAVLVFAGPISKMVLDGGALVSGLAFTFALPARNVTVRRLVASSDIEPAFAMDSVSYNLGRAIAPPLAMVAIASFGFGWAFALNAMSFAVFAICLVRAGSGHDESGSGSKTGPAESSKIWTGFLVAIRDVEIAVPLMMVAAITIADDPVLVLGPALASHLHVAANWSGWFIAALGAGAAMGSFLPSRRDPSIRQAAMALAFLAICMIMFVQSPWAWGSGAAAFGAGFCCLIANSTTKTILARKAGPSREAAVMAVWAIAWAGSKPMASLSDGLLADRIGLSWTGMILSVPALIPAATLGGLMVGTYVTTRLTRSRFRRARPVGGGSGPRRIDTNADETPPEEAAYEEMPAALAGGRDSGAA